MVDQSCHRESYRSSAPFRDRRTTCPQDLPRPWDNRDQPPLTVTRNRALRRSEYRPYHRSTPRFTAVYSSASLNAPKEQVLHADANVGAC